MPPLINVPQIDSCKPKEQASIPPQATTTIMADKQLRYHITNQGYKLIPSDLEGQEEPITGSDCSSN